MNLFVTLGVFWVMIYGTLMIVGQHGRWASFTKKIFGKFWGAHKMRIIWFVIGATVALYLLQPRYP
jgi:hypothetical protein